MSKYLRQEKNFNKNYECVHFPFSRNTNFVLVVGEHFCVNCLSFQIEKINLLILNNKAKRWSITFFENCNERKELEIIFIKLSVFGERLIEI